MFSRTYYNSNIYEHRLIIIQISMNIDSISMTWFIIYDMIDYKLINNWYNSYFQFILNMHAIILKGEESFSQHFFASRKKAFYRCLVFMDKHSFDTPFSNLCWHDSVFYWDVVNVSHIRKTKETDILISFTVNWFWDRPHSIEHI